VVALVGVARAELAVQAIDPLRPGSAQVVLLVSDGVPVDDQGVVPADLRVLVEQDGTARDAFVFQSASASDAIWTRLPDGLQPGPATLTLALGTDRAGEPLAFEVGRDAAAPAIWAVYRYGGPEDALVPLTSVRPGDRLLVVGAGMDTTGTTFVLHDATGAHPLLPTLAHTSRAVGVAAVLDLPPDLSPGPLRMSASVRICEPLLACETESTSPESESLSLLAE
jgi:hypothetical protein